MTLTNYDVYTRPFGKWIGNIRAASPDEALALAQKTYLYPVVASAKINYMNNQDLADFASCAFLETRDMVSDCRRVIDVALRIWRINLSMEAAYAIWQFASDAESAHWLACDSYPDAYVASAINKWVEMKTSQRLIS